MRCASVPARSRVTQVASDRSNLTRTLRKINTVPNSHTRVLRWFRSKGFAVQLIILAAVFDPLGFIAGYIIAPTFDIEPLYGGLAGLVGGSFVLSLHVLYTTLSN